MVFQIQIIRILKIKQNLYKHTNNNLNNFYNMHN